MPLVVHPSYSSQSGTLRDQQCTLMRNAEARVTRGVTAAREGDLEQALTMGERALKGDRQSVPSLIMTSRELAAEMKRRYAAEPAAQDYLARLQALGQEEPGFLPQ